ncbi:MAG: DNA methylase [Bacteroidaceae bacterium]
MNTEKTYLAIDLKSFYASVECVERNLDPLDTNLIVADSERTDHTICLAVSPSLKTFGISSRSRLFEVKKHLDEINLKRQTQNNAHPPKSYSYKFLIENPNATIDYIVATPRMSLYIDYSKRIFNIYLKYVSQEDIHPYSIDEVFIDISDYLNLYKTTPRQLATIITSDILHSTGITATVGIGSNLYLCKVAMDILAKKMPADRNGARIAELNEMQYRQTLWSHKPLTDFWRIGKGIANRLYQYGIDTQGKLARCSMTNENLLYELFGTNAEIIIDHAWGWEPCTIRDIKNYRPDNHSLSCGQILPRAYTISEATTIIEEMATNLILSLIEQNFLAGHISLYIGYEDKISPTTISTSLNFPTSSEHDIVPLLIKTFKENIKRELKIRRINITFGKLTNTPLNSPSNFHPSPIFNDKNEEEITSTIQFYEKELSRQKTIIKLRNKYGKNSILKGINFKQESTNRDRNKQIGGHKA